MYERPPRRIQHLSAANVTASVAPVSANLVTSTDVKKGRYIKSHLL